MAQREDSVESGEPLTSSPIFPKKLTQKPWLDVNIPISAMIMGEKRSGKGKMMDRIIDILYSNGFFIFYMFSALGYENLFTVINRMCKQYWDEYFKQNPEDKRKIIPSCMCHGIIPIVAMIPDYIEPDQKSVDKFNGLYWKTLDEYKQYSFEITQQDKEKLTKGELKKPKEFQPEQEKLPIKFMHFTPPTAPALVPAYRKQLREMVAVCKREHRVLVFSPAFTQSNKDKFETIAQSLRYIQDELCNDPLFDYVPREKGRKLSRWQLSNNKIAIVINEARAVFPSQAMSGDTESTSSKRAGYRFMPERRHAKSWVFIDTQSPMDLYDKLRNQFSDIKIFKRITRELCGEENSEFFDKVERACDAVITAKGFDPKKPVKQTVKMQMLFKDAICRLPELPDNYFCVRSGNGEYQFRKVKHARFHHKQDISDDWKKLTGITWKVNTSMVEHDLPKKKKKKPSIKKKKKKKTN